MGEQLMNIYASIKELEGVCAQMRLAMMTGLPSQLAAEALDSPETIEKFITAFKAITAQDYPGEDGPCPSI